MKNLFYIFCAAAMLTMITAPIYAVDSYGNPEDPVVAEVLGMQIRTKDPVEMQSVIGQQLFQNYAKENKIEASQEDIDLYVAKIDQFMRDERNKREAARLIRMQRKLGRSLREQTASEISALIPLSTEPGLLREG